MEGNVTDAELRQLEQEARRNVFRERRTHQASHDRMVAALKQEMRLFGAASGLLAAEDAANERRVDQPPDDEQLIEEDTMEMEADEEVDDGRRTSPTYPQPQLQHPQHRVFGQDSHDSRNRRVQQEGQQEGQSSRDDQPPQQREGILLRQMQQLHRIHELYAAAAAASRAPPEQGEVLRSLSLMQQSSPPTPLQTQSHSQTQPQPQFSHNNAQLQKLLERQQHYTLKDNPLSEIVGAPLPSTQPNSSWSNLDPANCTQSASNQSESMDLSELPDWSRDILKASATRRPCSESSNTGHNVSSNSVANSMGISSGQQNASLPEWSRQITETAASTRTQPAAATLVHQTSKAEIAMNTTPEWSRQIMEAAAASSRVRSESASASYLYQTLGDARHMDTSSNLTEWSRQILKASAAPRQQSQQSSSASSVQQPPQLRPEQPQPQPLSYSFPSFSSHASTLPEWSRQTTQMAALRDPLPPGYSSYTQQMPPTLSGTSLQPPALWPQYPGAVSPPYPYASIYQHQHRHLPSNLPSLSQPSLLLPEWSRSIMQHAALRNVSHLSTSSQHATASTSNSAAPDASLSENDDNDDEDASSEGSTPSSVASVAMARSNGPVITVRTPVRDDGTPGLSRRVFAELFGGDGRI